MRALFDRVDAYFDRRFTDRPGWVTLIELFLGLGWLRSAAAKFFAADWWSGREIEQFIVAHESQTLRWYRPIVNGLLYDFGGGWAFVVLVLELFIAATLITGVGVESGIAAAILLSLNFVVIGATTPGVFYLLLQLVLVLWFLERRGVRDARMRLQFLAIASLVLWAASVPFIQTLDPALVVEDPGAVLASLSACVAVSATATSRRLRRRRLSEIVIDLRIEGVVNPAYSAAPPLSVGPRGR